MAQPVARLESGWQPEELRIYWITDGRAAEVRFSRGETRRVFRFFNPSSLGALVELFDGIDSLEVFDRDAEDGFHRDFGRYRVVYFVDDPRSFDADLVDVEDAFYEAADVKLD